MKKDVEASTEARETQSHDMKVSTTMVVSEYELARQAKMERNKRTMENIGLLEETSSWKRQRNEERDMKAALRKKQKEEAMANFVPRRTTRSIKPGVHIMDEWMYRSKHYQDPCLLCGLKLPRMAMRDHIGAHMVAEGFRTIRCGFCGLTDGSCEHKVIQGGCIVSSGKQRCPKFIQIKTSALEDEKCSNVPFQCVKCDEWHWTYSMKTHWNEAHGGTHGISKKDQRACTITSKELIKMQEHWEHIQVRLIEDELADYYDGSSSGDDDLSDDLDDESEESSRNDEDSEDEESDDEEEDDDGCANENEAMKKETVQVRRTYTFRKRQVVTKEKNEDSTEYSSATDSDYESA
jgi:hypothetical protein